MAKQRRPKRPNLFRFRHISNPFSTYSQIVDVSGKLAESYMVGEAKVYDLLRSPLPALLSNIQARLAHIEVVKNNSTAYGKFLQTRVSPIIQEARDRIESTLMDMFEYQEALSSLEDHLSVMADHINAGLQVIHEDPKLRANLDSISDSVVPWVEDPEGQMKLRDTITRAHAALLNIPTIHGVMGHVVQMLESLYRTTDGQRASRAEWGRELVNINTSMSALRGLLDHLHGINHGLQAIQRVVLRFADGKPAEDVDALNQALNDTLQAAQANRTDPRGVHRLGEGPRPDRQRGVGPRAFEEAWLRSGAMVGRSQAATPETHMSIPGGSPYVTLSISYNGRTYYSREALLRHFRTRAMEVTWPTSVILGSPLMAASGVEQFFDSLLPPEAPAPLGPQRLRGVTVPPEVMVPSSQAEAEYIEALLEEDEDEELSDEEEESDGFRDQSVSDITREELQGFRLDISGNNVGAAPVTLNALEFLHHCEDPEGDNYILQREHIESLVPWLRRVAQARWIFRLDQWERGVQLAPGVYAQLTSVLEYGLYGQYVHAVCRDSKLYRLSVEFPDGGTNVLELWDRPRGLRVSRTSIVWTEGELRGYFFDDRMFRIQISEAGVMIDERVCRLDRGEDRRPFTISGYRFGLVRRPDGVEPVLMDRRLEDDDSGADAGVTLDRSGEGVVRTDRDG